MEVEDEGEVSVVEEEGEGSEQEVRWREWERGVSRK